MINNITIGSDPEFFIYKQEQPQSSIGVIEGTKASPEEVKPGFAVLKDNVLIEGNIPPSETKQGFIDNMRELKKMMSDILAEKDYLLISDDSAEFSSDVLANKEAMTFGCAPYINAWTLGMKSPDNLSKLNHRVAGFHIHIGYEYSGDISSDFMAMYIARAFDYFVVYPSRVHYNDKIRAKYYGDYGNFRIKPYGVEVRSLGGFFTQDKFLPWIWDQTMKTLEFCSKESNLELLDQVDPPEYNTKQNYKLLNINLNKQLYGNTPITTDIKSSILSEKTY